MAVIIYILSIISLWVIGRKFGKSLRLKHAFYTSFLINGIFLLLKSILKKDILNYGGRLMFLYGINESDDIFIVHWAAKISSLILFSGFQVIYLSFFRAGIVEMIISTAISITGFILPDIDLKYKIKQKNISILLDYPVFCTDLAVMCGAGLDLYEAWEKALWRKSRSTLYTEARRVLLKTSAGILFQDSLREFSANLPIPEIHTFVTIINQEIKSGSGGMASRLKDCAGRSWRTRERIARKKGEEASSKLVFPLAVGLAGVLLILASPAVMVMKGM